jgi:hypothetical protein
MCRDLLFGVNVGKNRENDMSLQEMARIVGRRLLGYVSKMCNKFAHNRCYRGGENVDGSSRQPTRRFIFPERQRDVNYYAARSFTSADVFALAQ